jgi:hypothetical protein
MKSLLVLLIALVSTSLHGASLSSQFARPPASARPWVYWFWNNGNVTKAGITADLEAMKRAGVGGVIIMDVAERFAPPRGTADFMNAEWQELFRFAVAEAKRLGLEINMTNGPGWCGSSGPWITPELSMQMLVSTNVTVAGPARFTEKLPRPHLPDRARDGWDSSVKYKEFYRDVAVLAFPADGNAAVPRESVLDLTANMTDGALDWQAPAGNWIVQRVGCTITGASTRPPVAGGNGLECDKLSREAMDAHFAGMLAKLIAQSGPVDSKALVATHIDSWEVGGQNWTPKLREEFQKRRGYDLTPFLPVLLQSKTIENSAVTDRFRWDFEQTLAELLAENYSGRLAELAHQHGMRLTIEGYDLPFGDEATYTAKADEPMSEFWTQSASPVTLRKGTQMASVGHIYGRTVVGAESFTSGDNEKWMLHPAKIKTLGDFEFCLGINRFVIHRYAHQPYLDRAPGSTMGPWGLHYERTQTWWEMSTAWHEYLARCQFMLRQGKFVADICYLRPENPKQTYFNPSPEPPAGYKYDECSAEALMQRVNVRDGRLVLPDGMSYRMLVLPAVKTMTPALAQKINQLVAAGATILVNSPAPLTSPSLAGYPKCDQEVASLTTLLWGDCEGRAITEHKFGKGRLVWGAKIEEVLRSLSAPPDFSAATKLNWIHRRDGNTEIYFVANPSEGGIDVNCNFRVKEMRPELWNPETGATDRLAAWENTDTGISIPLHLEGTGSRFIIFQKSRAVDPVVSLRRDGAPLLAASKPLKVSVQSATYGVPGDTVRSRNVRDKVQALVNRGMVEFQVASMAEGDDPAYGIVKTLAVNYTIDGRPEAISGQDTELVSLTGSANAAEPPAQTTRDNRGHLAIDAREAGRYEAITASGKVLHADVASVPAPQEIAGPWEIDFTPKWGAPDKITMDQLESWTQSTNSGVKYFSGTATYVNTFNWSGSESGHGSKTWLDLGDVEVMADVKLNGRDLGIVWKKPFQIDATAALHQGENKLEVRVANLWPNRMIGDAALPEKERFTWSSWEPFTTKSHLVKSGLLGPVTLQTVPHVQLK